MLVAYHIGGIHCLGTLALLEQGDPALYQGNDTGADHNAVRHILQRKVICIYKALAKCIGYEIKRVSEDREGEAVYLQDADHQGTCCQSGHGSEITKPGYSQKVHGKSCDLTYPAKADTNQKKDCLLTFLDNCQDGICRCHSGRPCALCREHLRSEAVVKDGRVYTGSQHHADQHGEHQLRISHDNRNTNRKNHTVRSGECSCGNGCLQQILSVDTTVFS